MTDDKLEKARRRRAALLREARGYADRDLRNKVHRLESALGSMRFWAASLGQDDISDREWKARAIFDICDDMGPGLNIRQLAQRLANENKTLPEEERWGPRGTTDWTVMDRYIRRLLRPPKE